MSEQGTRLEDVALGSKALACHVHMNSFGLDGKTVDIEGI
jgi:hypothetical protein